MSGRPYDNSVYWAGIHEDFIGLLRAVAWPGLCKEFNKLKYHSKQASFSDMLNRVTVTGKPMNILGGGVGIELWTALQMEHFRRRDMVYRTTTLDISPVALELVKKGFPDVDAVAADLKPIEIDRLCG